jgi:hypothetical protein
MGELRGGTGDYKEGCMDKLRMLLKTLMLIWMEMKETMGDLE